VTIRGSRRHLELLTGAVFVIAGLPKFVAFDWELDAFRRFGLPVPQAWVIAAGLMEIIGGILLLTHRRVREASSLLAITMAIAVYSSGILEGDVIPSLTLAPVLLAATTFLASHAARASHVVARAEPVHARPRIADGPLDSRTRRPWQQTYRPIRPHRPESWTGWTRRTGRTVREQVEGLVGRFPRGGSSPLRRMKSPANAGLFAFRPRRIGSRSVATHCCHRLSRSSFLSYVSTDLDDLDTSDA